MADETTARELLGLIAQEREACNELREMCMALRDDHRELKIKMENQLENGRLAMKAHGDDIVELKRKSQPISTRSVITAVLGIIATVIAGAIWLAQSLDGKVDKNEFQKVSSQLDSMTKSMFELNLKIDWQNGKDKNK